MEADRGHKARRVEQPGTVVAPQPIYAPDAERQARRLQHRAHVRAERRHQEHGEARQHCGPAARPDPPSPCIRASSPRRPRRGRLARRARARHRGLTRVCGKFHDALTRHRDRAPSHAPAAAGRSRPRTHHERPRRPSSHPFSTVQRDRARRNRERRPGASPVTRDC